MALIKCKECDKEVSSKAKTCPNCGVEIAAKIRKKRTWIIFITLAGILIILGTCNNQAREERERQEAKVHAEAYAKLTTEQREAYNKEQQRLATQRVKEATERQKQAEIAKEKATKEAELNKEQKRCTDSSMAFIMSQKFVKQRLKSPTTAKFPWGSDKVVKKQYIGDCKHKILAYVDSQNSFGAMIRTTYYAELQYIKGSDGAGNWRLLDLQIEN